MDGLRNNIMEDLDWGKLVIERGLGSELELERALVLNRRLRLLEEEDPSYKDLRKKLVDLIHQYENANWSAQSNISEKQIKESDQAEVVAEEERRFVENRKAIILKKIKKLGLSQQDLGRILGHGKSYTSEIINGVRPMSTADLTLIHRLLKIPLENLFSTLVPAEIQQRVKYNIEQLDSEIAVNEEGFELVVKKK
jgi:transcriptional regulator with XRE-family HTH domain